MKEKKDDFLLLKTFFKVAVLIALLIPVVPFRLIGDFCSYAENKIISKLVELFEVFKNEKTKK